MAQTLDTTGATLAGVVAGDHVSLVTTNAQGVFDTKDVGTDKTVTVKGLTLSGADAGNYVVVQPTTKTDIITAGWAVTRP